MSNYNFYFSPTGGTYQAANAVVSGWGESFTAVDLLKPKFSLKNELLCQDDICIVAVPSYGGRVPSAAIERLSQISGNGARAILVAAFGNRAVDDTLLELSDVLKEVGFECIAGIEAVTEHSLLPQYGAGRPDLSDIMELRDYAVKIKSAIENGTLKKPLELPGNRPYKKYSGVPLKPKANGKCVGCGVCAVECPTWAIPMDNPKQTDKTKCISCMHCVEICPQNARKVSRLMSYIAGKKMKNECSERKANKLYL